METTIKAIETAYKGHRFRSRLEARWAVAFDTLGVKWEYEKEGFDLGEAGWYLPDFYLPDFSMWVEVKGGTCSMQDRDKVSALEDQSGQDVVLVGDFLEFDGPFSPRCRGKTYPIPVPDNDQEAAIQRMFHGGNCMLFDGNLQIMCPCCSDDYVHIGDALNIGGDDNYGAGWGGRGDAVKIPMYCESEHAWDLRFGFHKGNTFVAIENLVEVEHDLLMVLADRSAVLRDKAINAARSARFEHGEKG